MNVATTKDEANGKRCSPGHVARIKVRRAAVCGSKRNDTNWKCENKNAKDDHSKLRQRYGHFGCASRERHQPLTYKWLGDERVLTAGRNCCCWYNRLRLAWWKRPVSRSGSSVAKKKCVRRQLLLSSESKNPSGTELRRFSAEKNEENRLPDIVSIEEERDAGSLRCT